ncbi:hypothetical protein BJX65DRAFT_265285 [Aspergillus insuetus]
MVTGLPMIGRVGRVFHVLCACCQAHVARDCSNQLFGWRWTLTRSRPLQDPQFRVWLSNHELVAMTSRSSKISRVRRLGGCSFLWYLPKAVSTWRYPKPQRTHQKLLQKLLHTMTHPHTLRLDDLDRTADMVDSLP